MTVLNDLDRCHLVMLSIATADRRPGIEHKQYIARHGQGHAGNPQLEVDHPYTQALRSDSSRALSRSAEKIEAQLKKALPGGMRRRSCAKVKAVSTGINTC